MFNRHHKCVGLGGNAIYIKGLHGTMTRKTSESEKVNVQASNIDAFRGRVTQAIQWAGGPTKMAKQVGVSTGALSKWRRGETEPTRTRLIKMACAAGVSVDWLVTGEGDKHKESRESGARVHRQGGDSEEYMELLEEVISITTQQLQEREIELRPKEFARLMRVLYCHFRRRNEAPNDQTVSCVIDLAAHR